VCHTTHLDALSKALVHVFHAHGMLAELQYKIFSKEVRCPCKVRTRAQVELADTAATLFRGNTLASKVMAVCFKLHGTAYLQSVLEETVGAHRVTVAPSGYCT